MAIAIVVLQSGERVITDLQEVREENKEDGKPMCLMFIRPYNLNVESTDAAVVNQEVQVRFSKWVPYSSDTQFKVPFSSVTAVGAPDPGLAQAYEQTVQQAVATEQAAGNAREVTQVPPPAADTGFSSGQGFGGEDEQHDDHIPGYPDTTTLPDGSVDLDHMEENLPPVDENVSVDPDNFSQAMEETAPLVNETEDDQNTTT
tara:strand:+ start:614 stop:1219 length:606 start_codon:yes stop_codon:yes gene_type:complete